jgi:class 3 adenylate cyclase
VVEVVLERGEAEAMRSHERLAVIMFTDMVGFSGIAARLDAEACAAFLNAHLTLLAAAIEAEGGIIDKFMGDAVMAFWPVHPRAEGAGEAASAAWRAALAIRGIVHADNALREVPIRVRVGLHCGRVVLGNVGTGTRLNFTIVGAPVNTAQRIEALAKELLPEDEVAILLSGEVAALLPPGTRLRSLGAHALQGRPQPIEILAPAADARC